MQSFGAMAHQAAVDFTVGPCNLHTCRSSLRLCRQRTVYIVECMCLVHLLLTGTMICCSLPAATATQLINPAIAGMGESHQNTNSSVQKENTTLQQCQVQPYHTEPSDTDKPASPQHAEQYIVRFTKYKLPSEHLAALKACLQVKDAGWAWIERHNEAYKLPTDFGLLSITEQALKSVEQQLLGVPGVKDLHLDRKFTRSIQTLEDDIFKVHKRPGRFSSAFSDGIAEPNWHMRQADYSKHQGKRRLLAAKDGEHVTNMMQADELHKLGFSGKGVRVGVFDTGIRQGHEHIRNIKDRTNWTSQQSLSDGLGHGTFVAGVIASQDTEGCPGFAPDVDLYTFKVFTDDQVSYTSWFMDAFNYAIHKKVHIINLSIGGPDHLDLPYVDKVLEVTSNGIIMVSAIGNDGPDYGTVNNPADQNDVIGVGGINDKDALADFSSRGMTTWELPLGYGRVKPDVVAYGKDVAGSHIGSGCRSLSGTSVASPVVAGGVCLLASTLPEEQRWTLLNPASIKQVLVEGADRLNNSHIYEQGAGKVNLLKSHKILRDYKLRASIVPSRLFLDDCPYMWPFCKQPLYASSMPVVFNATILNALGVAGKLEDTPIFIPSNRAGELLRVHFEYSALLWPWSGYLAAYIWVSDDGAQFDGVAEGQVEFTVVSALGVGESEMRRSTVQWPVRVRIIPTPPRSERLLWDQFHSINYPPKYIPRDNLEVKHVVLDWHGDHPHTNFHTMYDVLRDSGYYLEILSSPMTCFNASHYGALLLVDPEEEYYKEEIEKLQADVEQEGLALLVFGEWYSVASMLKMHFFDDNTRSWWTPVTGGANVPALNDLLKPFGIAFGDSILQGSATIGKQRIPLDSAANIIRFPASGHLYMSNEPQDVAVDKRKTSLVSEHAVFGVTPFGKGHVAVLGDSNGLDANLQESDDCYDLLLELLQHVLQGHGGELASRETARTQVYSEPGSQLPVRRHDINFTQVSYVLSHPLQCYFNSPCAFTPNAELCRAREDSATQQGAHNKLQTARNQAAGTLPMTSQQNTGKGVQAAGSKTASTQSGNERVREGSEIVSVELMEERERLAAEAEKQVLERRDVALGMQYAVQVGQCLVVGGVIVLLLVWRFRRSRSGAGSGARGSTSASAQV